MLGNLSTEGLTENHNFNRARVHHQQHSILSIVNTLPSCQVTLPQGRLEIKLWIYNTML